MTDLLNAARRVLDSAHKGYIAGKVVVGSDALSDLEAALSEHEPIDEPDSPGHWWFRERHNDGAREWGVVEVTKTPNGLFSMRHGRYVEDVGKRHSWDPEWARIPEPTDPEAQ